MRAARRVRRAVTAVAVAAAASAWAATPPQTDRPRPAAPVPPAGAPAEEPARGVAVEGSDAARLAVAPELAAALDGWSSAGYRVRRSGEGEVTVEVRLDPLRSEAAFAPVAAAAPAATAIGRGTERSTRGASPGPDLAALAMEITQGATTRYQAVSAVLGWLVRNVLDERAASPLPPAAGGTATPRGSAVAAPAGPGATPATVRAPGAGGGPAGGPPAPGRRAAEPSPAEVLARRAGDPAAIARLAVALLGEVGIEARVVRGLVAGTPDAAGPRGPHAWIEVVYPDRGGVLSDPLHTHHYVPATYLPLPASESADRAGSHLDEGGSEPPTPTAALVERTDRRLTVDVYPAGSPGITARKNRDRQEAGALRVIVAGGPRGSAVLAGQGTRRARELVRGESVFVGLAAGSYTLEVFLEGRAPTRREVVIAPRERSAVYLPEGRSATAAPPLGGGPTGGPRQVVPTGGRSTSHRPRP